MAQVVAQRGYAAATVSQVVERAGVSRRTFYEQFPDKEACFLAAYDVGVEVLRGHIRAAVEPLSPGDWRGRVRAGIVTYLSVLSEEPAFAWSFTVEVLGAGTAALERRSAVVALFAGLWQGVHQIARSVEPAIPRLPREVFVTLTGGLEELARECLRTKGASALPELAEPALRVAMTILGGPRHAASPEVDGLSESRQRFSLFFLGVPPVTTDSVLADAPLKGQFNFPAVETLVYGPGALGHLPDLVDRLGGTRVFVLASNSLVKAAAFDSLRPLLGDRLVGVFHQVRQHVPRESVLEAAEQARGCGADLLVSLGGGSPIDCAKAVALCLAEEVTDPEGFDAYRVRFTYPDQIEVPEVPGPVVPIVAVPTTLSGAEHTELFGATDLTVRTKHLYGSSKFVARAVILDPELAGATPAWLWKASGMRAVDHAIEGILSLNHVPFMDALALEALRILRGRLVHSAASPQDAAARTDCLLAAWLAMFALPNVGVGLSHAIGHQLGAQFDIPHGITSCITLPRVMAFNAFATLPRQRRIAEAMGSDVDHLSDEAAAAEAVDAVRRFVRLLDLPHTLRQAGARREELPLVADKAMGDVAVAANPVPVSRDDILTILESAWD